MKSRLLILLCLASLLSCVDETMKPESSDDKISAVESNLIPPVYIEGDPTWTLEERMEHYGVPGVSIAVIHDGEIAWTKTYGTVEKDSAVPVTENTLFQAASISKPVTAYAALGLVEQGKIDLNANINSQLKSWSLGENEFTANTAVTLKNLLNHSAGTTVHGFLGYSPGLPVPNLIQVLNGESPANSNAIVVDKTPEESFRYSGGGYNVVQQLMIDVEGKSFPEIMHEQVLSPLGMDHSTFDQPLEEAQLKLAATGYLPNGDMTTGKRHTYPEMAAAGLWTTAEDLAKFALNIQQTLKGESTVGLSHDMTDQMLTPFVEEFVGLGIFISQRGDQVYFEHGGWNEGFSSEMVAHKEGGYGAVVMINANQPDFIAELIRSVALTYDWANYFPRYKESDSPVGLDPDILGKYSMRGFDIIEVVDRTDQLWYRYGAEGEPVPFTRITDSTFVLRDADVLYQFKRDEESGVMKLLMLNSRNHEIESEYEKLPGDAVLPIEILVSGDFEGALEAYKSAQAKDENDPAVNENYLNGLGYRYLFNDKKELAKEMFAINMALYPESFNVYDSYAEACMELGETELAIEYYQKSLDLNPENDNARNLIQRMQEGE